MSDEEEDIAFIIAELGILCKDVRFAVHLIFTITCFVLLISGKCSVTLQFLFLFCFSMMSESMYFALI